MPESSSTTTSIVFVVSALETIGASKEVKRKKQLGESVERALAEIKQHGTQLPNPELIFEPLHLATRVNSIPITTTALDCIGKLISYSYFSITSIPSSTSQDGGDGQTTPLIERAIDTICDSFQGEATPS